jgi:hypothetical protein
MSKEYNRFIIQYTVYLMHVGYTLRERVVVGVMIKET